jgi:hypothetical protein
VLMTHMTSATESELLVLDTVDPIHPVEDCTLVPAAGGRFITATRIAFWVGNTLRGADIAAGTVAVTATVPAVPTDGAFSPDGSLFAYRVGDDTNGLRTHLFVAGHDHTLVTRAGIGGHGGPPYGPTAQLEFSSDGKYLLSVDSLDANFGSGPPNFLVYDQNGSTVFQSATAAFGRWAKQGDELYFLAPSQTHGISGDLHSWQPTTGETTAVRGLASYFWPELAPDNASLLFNSYDSAGLPHLWSVNLSSGTSVQLASGISTHPVFVGQSVVWSTEEMPCNCGPGGASAPDGELVVHDLQTGHDTTIGLAAYAPGGLTTRSIVDVWLG